MARIIVTTDDGWTVATFSDEESAPDCIGQVHQGAASLVEHLRDVVAQARQRDGRDTETGDRLPAAAKGRAEDAEPLDQRN